MDELRWPARRNVAYLARVDRVPCRTGRLERSFIPGRRFRSCGLRENAEAKDNFFPSAVPFRCVCSLSHSSTLPGNLFSSKSKTMTSMKEDAYKMSGDGEPEIVATAIPSNEPAVPAGHQRFYCSKCRTVRTGTRNESARIVEGGLASPSLSFYLFANKLVSFSLLPFR
jgi:hypothetical protein